MSSNSEWAFSLPTAKVFSANFLAVPIPPKFSPAKVLCYTVLCVGRSKVKAGIQLKYIPEKRDTTEMYPEKSYSFEFFDLSFNLKIEVVVEGSVYL